MARERGALKLRGAMLQWGARTYVMAIVNVTPDSFSGDGIDDVEIAVRHACAQFEAGADMLDIGGESTRPGHVPIDERTEIARVVPVIRSVRERYPNLPVAVDTYKPAVARAAQSAGADAINSVWGAPDELLRTAAELNMPIIATHNAHHADYGRRGVIDTVAEFLEQCAQRAAKASIAPERIILDPGIGFGKTADQNIQILRAFDRFVSLGFPTLLGVSRKTTIGKLTGRLPRERSYGTMAACALAIGAGVDVVRVHDVAAARDAVAVADAIVRDWRPEGWTE